MLNNTFVKLANEKKLTVGYFGGSITEGAGASDGSKTSYRARVTKWFRDAFPDAEITEIQAAIGGTGSDLGMYRCDIDLLSHHPDLVFIEFAVNDNGMTYENIIAQTESIYRKILRENPYADIISVITTTAGIAREIENGGEYVSRSAHITTAHHYGVPVLDVGSALHCAVLRAGGDFLTYTADTVHPNDDGYGIYTNIITSRLEKWMKENEATAMLPHKLPEVMSAGARIDAYMIFPTEAENYSSDGFTATDESLCGRYPRYIEATVPGAEFSFDFTGETCAFYWMLALDSGNVSVTVDDLPEISVSSWDLYCEAFNRAGAAFFMPRLTYGKHHVTVRVSAEKAEKSKGTAIRIGTLMIS